MFYHLSSLGEIIGHIIDLMKRIQTKEDFILYASHIFHETGGEVVHEHNILHLVDALVHHAMTLI